MPYSSLTPKAPAQKSTPRSSRIISASARERRVSTYLHRTQSLKIAHVGTFPPRQCGIATYMQDVISAVHNNPSAAAPTVVAMAAPGEDLRYAWPVRHVIGRDRPGDYLGVARSLRSEEIDLVSIQHEHGIYGGCEGDMLDRFLDGIDSRIAVVTTLHTVLPKPNDAVRKALRSVTSRSNKVVVLNSRAIPILESAYGIDTANVVTIPHGTPTFDQSRRPIVRSANGLEGQTVLSTFGLIGPGKGLEHAIAAVARNAEAHPDLHYYILGATHPSIVRESGEKYRDSLINQAAELGVSDKVHFVNRYLSIEELTDWLLATDIYVTPYLNSDQIVSGTLSYAVAAGRPVLSTPYLHAIELLDGKAGLLTPFNDADAMASNLNKLLSNPELRAGMAEKAREFGKESSWSQIELRYWDVFRDAIEEFDKDRAAAEKATLLSQNKIAWSSSERMTAKSGGQLIDALRTH